MFMVGLTRGGADFIGSYLPIPTAPYMAPVYERVDGVLTLQRERYAMSWQRGAIAPMLGYASYFIGAVLVGGVISLRYSRIRFTAVSAACGAVTLTMLPALWPTVPGNVIAVVNLGYHLRFLFPLTTIIGIPLGGTLVELVVRKSIERARHR
jgi:hypothetical protein